MDTKELQGYTLSGKKIMDNIFQKSLKLFLGDLLTWSSFLNAGTLATIEWTPQNARRYFNIGIS